MEADRALQELNNLTVMAGAGVPGSGWRDSGYRARCKVLESRINRATTQSQT